MIRESRLTNGMRVLTESIPHALSVSVGIWILRGSRRITSYNVCYTKLLRCGHEPARCTDTRESGSDISADTVVLLPEYLF